MSYYYDDVYGSYGAGGYSGSGAAADMYGGAKKKKLSGAALKAKEAKQARQAPAQARPATPRSPKPATPRSPKPATPKSPEPATPASGKKARHFAPVSKERCPRMSGKSDKARRSQYLGRRCDKREEFLYAANENFPKGPKEKVEAVRRMRHSAARLGREQSKRRAFVKGTNGFEKLDTIRTSSGYTIHRSHAQDDLRKRKGRYTVNTMRPTHDKFQAWREAVAQVGPRAHPTKRGALLAKKGGDEHEDRYYGEILAVYRDILDNDGQRLAADVKKYNSNVNRSNAAVRARSEKYAKQARDQALQLRQEREDAKAKRAEEREEAKAKRAEAKAARAEAKAARAEAKAKRAEAPKSPKPQRKASRAEKIALLSAKGIVV